VSLILDALRKADSERAREAVPGLYTQPVPPLSLEEVARPGGRPKPWMWIGVGVGVVLLVALVWFVARREAPRPLAEVPFAATDPMPATRAPAPMPPPNAVMPEPVREVAAPAPWPSQERKAAPKQSAKGEEPPAAQVPTLTPLYSREQLPDNVRAALPPLAVGGSIYSNMPANRSLILDGRLYRESDQLTTDLQLEEIGLKTAVLRFRDYRFEIRY
jgi:general secretion pathway protein B